MIFLVKLLVIVISLVCLDYFLAVIVPWPYRRKKKVRVFLICPVRKIKEEEKAAIKEYVESLESKGYKVHWPLRDTDQNDPIGIRICTDNARAIIKAEEIHVWYNPTSSGSKFDLGMVFMFNLLNPGRRKKIVIANPLSVRKTNYKSFENLLLYLANKNNA